MSLTTDARVKTALGIPAGITFHDAAIAQAVEYANDKVLRAIGQPGGLVGTTRTDYPQVYTDAQRMIQLDRSPVISIIGITNGDYVVQTDEYRVDEENGEIYLLQGNVGSRRLLSSWSDTPDTVVVSYLYGYTDDTCPNELQRAADMIAVHNMQQTPQLGRTRVRNSSFGFDVSTAVIPKAAANILARYEDVFHP